MADNFPYTQLLGTFRRFGIGPAYQVVEPLKKLPDNDWLMKIKLTDNGKESQYRCSSILRDPMLQIRVVEVGVQATNPSR